MIELIDWESFNQNITNKQVDQSVQLVVICILKILGKDVKLNYLHEFDKVIWEYNLDAIISLKILLLEIHNPSFRPLTKKALQEIKTNFLCDPSLEIPRMIEIGDKNALYLTILLN
jgi:hypothetical protein